MTALNAAIALVLIALWTAPAAAQPQGPACEVTRKPFVQGGTSSAEMTMANDGRPCRFTFRFSETNPPDSWELVTEPQHGQVQFQESAAAYRPDPGFTGSDRFVIAVFGRSPGTTKQQARNGRFEISVTVKPKP